MRFLTLPRTDNKIFFDSKLDCFVPVEASYLAGANLINDFRRAYQNADVELAQNLLFEIVRVFPYLSSYNDIDKLYDFLDSTIQRARGGY